MVLAFTLRPICHPFTPTKPLSPDSSLSVPPIPATRITRPSAELQPTCKGHNKNRWASQSLTQTYRRRLFSHNLFFFFIISLRLTTCSLPLPHPFVYSDVLGTLTGTLSWLRRPQDTCQSFWALIFVMLCHISKLARLMRNYYNDYSFVLNILKIDTHWASLSQHFWNVLRPCRWTGKEISYSLIEVYTPDLIIDLATPCAATSPITTDRLPHRVLSRCRVCALVASLEYERTPAFNGRRIRFDRVTAWRPRWEWHR